MKRLLPGYAGGNLSALCSWADQIRHNFRWRWTAPLHYIDTPDFACNYGYCRKLCPIFFFFLVFFLRRLCVCPRRRLPRHGWA